VNAFELRPDPGRCRNLMIRRVAPLADIRAADGGGAYLVMTLPPVAPARD
jgi:hypothetical protein